MSTFPLDNTEYTAKDLGAWCATRTRGVFSGDTHFATTTNGDLSVTISPGLAWLKMAEFWGVNFMLEDALVLQSDVADGSLTRWDAVCIRLDKNQNKADVILKKGAFGSNPAYPPIERDLNYDELFVSVIRRGAGSVAILPSDIVDLRLSETYCGIMRDGVTGISTQVMYDQFSVFLQSLQSELQGVEAQTEFMLKSNYDPGQKMKPVAFADEVAAALLNKANKVPLVSNDLALAGNVAARGTSNIYTKNEFGEVTVLLWVNYSIQADGFTIGTPLANLPTGFIPPKNLPYPVTCSTLGGEVLAGIITVTINGTIQVTSLQKASHTICGVLRFWVSSQYSPGYPLL